MPQADDTFGPSSKEPVHEPDQKPVLEPGFEHQQSLELEAKVAFIEPAAARIAPGGVLLDPEPGDRAAGASSSSRSVATTAPARKPPLEHRPLYKRE